MDEDYKYREKLYEDYLREHESLEKERGEINKSADKIKLALCSGALALLANLPRSIEVSYHPNLFITSWIAFGTSITFSVLGFWAANKSWSKQIEILKTNYSTKQKNEYKQLINPSGAFGETPQKSKNHWTSIGKWFNVITDLGLTSGILFLILFVTVSVQTMSDNKNNKQPKNYSDLQKIKEINTSTNSQGGAQSSCHFPESPSRIERPQPRPTKSDNKKSN